MMDSAAVDNYVRVFEQRSQTGSGFDYPVFQGARHYQTGSGFGQIFQNALRFLLPVAASVGSAFLGNLVKARETGAEWKSSLKSTIAPTANTALSSVAEQMHKVQSGSGRKRRGKAKKHYKKAKKHRVPKEIQNWNF